MSALADLIVRHRWFFLVLAIVLLIPGLYGLRRLKIEYDLMTYLPKETPSVEGQRILDREFGFGATAFLLVKGRQDWEVEDLKSRVAAVPGVNSVSWVDDLADIVVPRGYLDPKLLQQYFRGKATVLQLTFTAGGATPEMMATIARLKSMLGKGESLAGQAVTLAEMRTQANREKPRMLLTSLALILAVLLLSVPSPVVPFLFLFTLGFAIVTNLGLNYFFGYRLSYLTNSIVTALQLGVSLDFCIFLWERYREERASHRPEEAMKIAIRQTATAVFASAITTVFGFSALAAMRNGLGADLGITMARGVLFSLVSCLTILPSLLLITDRAVFAWQHRSLLPDLGFLARFVPRARIPLFIVFLLLFIPALYGASRARISYDIGSTFSAKLPSIQAANEMRRTFGTVDTVNLVSKDIEPYELERILGQMERIPGIKQVVAYNRLVDPAIPNSFVPERVKYRFVAGAYQNTTVLLANRASSPQTAKALARVQEILRPYRGRAFLAGQAAISADLAAAARSDLPRVNTLSLILVLLTLAVAFLSLILPPILVLAVELAIWFNQSFTFFAGRDLFYFGSIAIGAIQLGATVDYAVLLTSRFREELGRDRPVPAMVKALRESARAVLISATTLFVATMGIYVSTSLELVQDLVLLIARGAIITVSVVLLLFPAFLLVCHRLIGRTTLHWPSGRHAETELHDKGVPSCSAEQ